MMNDKERTLLDMDLTELQQRATEIFAMPHDEKDDAEWGFCEADLWADALKCTLDLRLDWLGDCFDHARPGDEDPELDAEYDQVKALWDRAKIHLEQK